VTALEFIEATWWIVVLACLFTISGDARSNRWVLGFIGLWMMLSVTLAMVRG
jgi:hypothetical protein